MKKRRASSGVAQNRRGSFDIAVTSTYEAGIVLTGPEIKSVREDRVQLTGSYVRLMRPPGKSTVPEVVLVGMQTALAPDPQRTRRLLMHKKEILQLERELAAEGKTAIPLKLYFSHGYLKVQIGVGKGRKKYDKRELLKQRDIERRG